ncbi:putative NAC domain-containing protein 67-like [Iris pallida]|uniref:NAC domain-containing protein 67-like n=1 Tax=Iris pallida TaxID=29817 RepID=A0AAX6EKH0_IRIPA|nr:putative NAC domain-containing protein 67-like [Iris pallida]
MEINQHPQVKSMERSAGADLDLPGFRFHPTEEELLDFYLRRMVRGKKFNVEIIGTIHLYRYDPWELPRLAKIGEREWYFFVPRDRRQANGGRPNRTTERGFWKATGSDRPIRSAADPKRLIGLKKTLVFYLGRAPRGSKTDWVMNEYRLPDSSPSSQEDIVLCKIYRKATSLKELEQRAAMEEEARANSQGGSVSVTDTTLSSSDLEAFHMSTAFGFCDYRDQASAQVGEVVKEEVAIVASSSSSPPSSLSSVVDHPVDLPELQVPTYSLDWMQDPFLTQLRSPWHDQLSPYSNLLNF